MDVQTYLSTFNGISGHVLLHLKQFRKMHEAFFTVLIILFWRSDQQIAAVVVAQLTVDLGYSLGYKKTTKCFKVITAAVLGCLEESNTWVDGVVCIIFIHSFNHSFIYYLLLLPMYAVWPPGQSCGACTEGLAQSGSHSGLYMLCSLYVWFVHLWVF